MSDTLINWYDFSFWGNEKEYVNNALNSTWLSGGGYIEKLEKSIAEKHQLNNAYAVANGTAALQLAFLCLDVKPGDEVIVPAFGFMAAANVLKLMHATPVFCDVNPNTWCLDIQQASSKITSKTKGVVAIHTYGVVDEIEKLSHFCKSKSLWLIEDCAESIFSKFNGKFCGNFGDISTFSFHATKTIATGEGGLVVCNDPHLEDKLKLIRSHGLRREKRHYWHEYYGNNFRLSNILAAIGYGQLEKHQEIIANKQRVYDVYREELKKISNISLQHFSNKSEPVIWAVAICLNNEMVERDFIMDQLKEKGIECRPGFYTPDQLPIYSEGNVRFPIANSVASRTIVLPSYPALNNDTIKKICSDLIDFLCK